MKTAFATLAIVLISSTSIFAKQNDKFTMVQKETLVKSIAEHPEVSSINRRNFYTGLSFTRIVFNANLVDYLGPANQESFDDMFEKAKILHGILKGKKEAEQVIAAFKIFKSTKNYKIFSSDISSLSSSYSENLAEEQKFYFKVGNISAQLEHGIETRNSALFILTELELELILKNTPKEIPSDLVSSLKKTGDILSNGDFLDDDSDDYVKLHDQLRLVFNLMGQLSDSDVN